MVMDERTKVSHHHHQQHHQQRGGDTGAGDRGGVVVVEDPAPVEGISSIENSPPPSTTEQYNGTTPVGDGPTGNGPSVNVYLIGLEFVRQYYTVLHQGPLYLHRFYSDDSSFVHDDSKAVYGQLDIRERIQQLNFCNCVAKILQVDSHETLGSGVVIQVRGELSNNGQPMRRFMQTFVLAPQSPKRFYVRNDIFHYQDEVPSKDEFKSLAQSSMESMTTHDDADDEKSDDEPITLKRSNTPPSVVTIVSINNNMEELAVRDDPDHPTLKKLSELNIGANEDQEQQASPRHGSHGFTVGQVSQLAVEEETKSTAPAVVSALAGLKETTVATPTTVTPTGTGTPEIGTPTPVAKTYANLFKSGPPNAAVTSATTQIRANPPFPVKTSGSNSGTGLAPSAVSPASENEEITSPPTSSPQPPNDSSTSAGAKNMPSGRGGFGPGFGRDRAFRGDRDRRERERLTSRSSNAGNEDTGSVDGDGGRKSNINYPDTHQLFVGNLPHTVTHAEIKEIFAKYGVVAEVKILKPNQKNAGSKVPYFCFVVFEEAAAAQLAINEKTKITMKMNDGSNRRLNVEEKRPRDIGEGRGFSGSGGNSGSNFPRDSRDNMSNPSGGGAGNNTTGGGSSQFRRGESGGNTNRPSNPPGGGPGEQHRNLLPPRSRTFRGSHRGGGTGGGGNGSGAR